MRGWITFQNSLPTAGISHIDSPLKYQTIDKFTPPWYPSKEVLGYEGTITSVPLI